VSEETRAPCDHQTTRWNANNTRLVCADCGAEFAPGICIRCGGRAMWREGFVCAQHTAAGALS
jgi:hypothetical protein